MSRLDPFATNPYAVQVQPVEFPEGDNSIGPFGKTYHGLTIVNDAAQIIGRITSWNPTSYTREATLQYELNYRTFGRPVDQIPSKSTGYTIAGTSAELWDKEIERRFLANESDAEDGGMAGSVFNDLADQVRPFRILEHWFRGNSLYRTWEYNGCWLLERNEDAYTVDGDGRVMSNFSIQYVSRKNISGAA